MNFAAIAKCHLHLGSKSSMVSVICVADAEYYYLNILVLFLFSGNCSSSLLASFLSSRGLVGSHTHRYIVEFLVQQKSYVACCWLSYRVFCLI